MTENVLIVATQYTAGPKVHLIGSSQLTVKKDNGPDTGVSRSIDSCELREHARACDGGGVNKLHGYRVVVVRII